MRTLKQLSRSLLCFSFASTLCTASALADDAPTPGSAMPAAVDDKRIGVGGDLLFTLPLGDYGDVTGPQIGGSIRLGYYVVPRFEAYVRAGYLHGLSKEQGAGPFTIKTSISNIPIMLGGRYFVLEDFAGLFVNAEVGVNMFKAKVELGGQSQDGDTETRFGLNAGAGYVISRELPISIGAQFSVLNLAGKEEGEKTLTAINFLVGYEARF